jgi:hypothetical protein
LTIHCLELVACEEISASLERIELRLNADVQNLDFGLFWNPRSAQLNVTEVIVDFTQNGASPLKPSVRKLLTRGDLFFGAFPNVRSLSFTPRPDPSFYLTSPAWGLAQITHLTLSDRGLSDSSPKNEFRCVYPNHFVGVRLLTLDKTDSVLSYIVQANVVHPELEQLSLVDVVEEAGLSFVPGLARCMPALRKLELRSNASFGDDVTMVPHEFLVDVLPCAFERLEELEVRDVAMGLFVCLRIAERFVANKRRVRFSCESQCRVERLTGMEMALEALMTTPGYKVNWSCDNREGFFFCLKSC